jgi:acetyl esterase/lipase
MPFNLDNRVLCSLVAVIGLAGCSPLGLFDSVVPHDPGSRMAASDIAYGDDPRQRLDVYVPTEATTRPLPVVVFFYGGSWSNGSKDRYRFAGRALAARGAVAVVADYRLVPDVTYPAFIEDGAAATAWARDNAARFGGDPERVFLSGHSAGAHMAVSLALDPRFLEARGMTQSDIAGVVSLAGPFEFEPERYRATRRAFAGALDDPRIRPMTLASPDAPPMLLLHGGADTTVEPRNAPALAEALSNAGVAARAKVYPDMGHAGILLALSRPLRSTETPVLADIADFISATETPVAAAAE